MSEENTIGIISGIKSLLQHGEDNAVKLGRFVAELADTKGFTAFGYTNLKNFLKKECNLDASSATRCMHKYRLTQEYPRYVTQITNAYIVVCDIAYKMHKGGHFRALSDLIPRLNEVKIAEILTAYKNSGPESKKKNYHDHRIVATFNDEESAEYHELEDTIMQAFNLNHRREVVLAAMRSLSTEATIILSQKEQGASPCD